MAESGDTNPFEEVPLESSEQAQVFRPDPAVAAAASEKAKQDSEAAAQNMEPPPERSFKERLIDSYEVLKEDFAVTFQAANQYLTGQSSEKAEVVERVENFKALVQQYAELHAKLEQLFENQEKKRQVFSKLSFAMAVVDERDPADLQGRKNVFSGELANLAKNQETYVLAIKDFRNSVATFKDSVLKDLDINVSKYGRVRKLHDAAALSRYHIEQGKEPSDEKLAAARAEEARLRGLLDSREKVLEEKLEMLNQNRRSGLSAMLDILVRVTMDVQEGGADILQEE